MAAKRRVCTLAGILGAFTLTSGANDDAALPNSQIIDLGIGIYRQHCASCHGSNGEGAQEWRKPNEQGELPAPPHGPEGHTWRHSDAMLHRMISQGWRDRFNKTDRLTMPAFEGILTKEEISAVIAYLKTLWTPEQRRFQESESAKHNGGGS